MFVCVREKECVCVCVCVWLGVWVYMLVCLASCLLIPRESQSLKPEHWTEFLLPLSVSGLFEICEFGIFNLTWF